MRTRAMTSADAGSGLTPGATSPCATGVRGAGVAASASPGMAASAPSASLGLLDLVVVRLDAGGVLVDRRIGRLHVRLGERLLLLDELLQAVDVGDVFLLPCALLVVACDVAGVLARLRAAFRFRYRRRRCGGSRGRRRRCRL